MSAFTDYIKTTMGAATFVSLGDGSGTAAANSGPNGVAGLYVASPTLSGLGDDYGDPTGKCMAINGSTQFCRLPTTAMPNLVNPLVPVTVGFWFKVTGVPGSPIVFGFATDTSGYDNEFNISLNRNASGGNTNAKACVRYSTTASGNFGAEVTHNASIFDDQWHYCVCVRTLAGGGTWQIFIDGVAGTAVAGADAKAPALQTYMGIGALVGNNGTSLFGQMTGSVMDFFYVEAAMTAAQIQLAGDKFNARTGDKVYYGSRLSRLAKRATSQIVPILSIGDSNIFRTTVDPIGPGAEQGFIITLDRLIRGATGNRLVGRHIGPNGSPFNGSYQNGVLSNLLGNVDNVPNNSADPWPVGLYAYDPTEYNRLGPGYGSGFQPDSGYIASGSVAATTAEGIFLGATDADWPLDAAGTITLKIRRATFSAGSGTYTLQARRVTGNTSITANNPFSTNTGADTFTTDDTITIGSNIAANYGDVRVSIGAATGPVAFGPTTVLNSSRNSGFTTGIIWAYGGQPTGKFMVAWKSLLATATGEGSPDPFTRFSNIISAWLAHVNNTSNPTLCIHIAEIQNDLNDTGTSYVWNPATFTFDNGTSTGNKRLGVQENMQAIINCFRTIWQGLGFSRSNLFFLFGPYHEIANPSSDTSAYNMKNQMQRGVYAVCDNDTTYQTCFIIDGPETVPYATMNAASGYDGGGPAHMTLAGYRLLGTSAGSAAAQAANVDTAGGFRSRTRNWRAR